MKLQREVNGNLFTIHFPVKEILQEIEENKEYWMESYNEVVGCTQTEYLSEEEIKEQIDKLIEAVHIYSTQEDRINQLFRILPLKKNKKLSKQSKPVLHTMKCGTYLEDHYGWRTQQLRMAATDELNAEVYLESTIVCSLLI